MKITQLKINRFRHLENVDIAIGDKLTAIAGQNGIGKSSILGLLGHVCREKSGFKTIDDRAFETEYSEIFKFSYPSFDKPKEHDYIVYFDDGTEARVLSYERLQKGVPKSLRLRVGKSSEGGGKIDFPVLYLGLKRLFPLAQEIDVKQNVGDLIEEEIKFFHEAHRSILLMDDIVTPQQVKSTNKSFYAASTNKYDSLGNSAGQDNIGQILTAIISFKRLKLSLGNQYLGGILLIDEIDATLFSAAQDKLIEFLFSQSAKLNLQIVFTTHSIDILDQLLTTKYKYHSKVCYLHKSKGDVEVVEESDINKIVSNLKADIIQKIEKPGKLDLYLEDEEAKIFLNNIISNTNKKRIKIINASFGCDELLHLANKKIPAFTKSLIILDGDKKESIKKPHPKNVVLLPGTNRPEDILFFFLHSLPEDHDFWEGLGGYTKQICFRNQQIIGDRGSMKEWFKKQIKHWGKNGNKLFRIWKQDNLELVNEFNNKMEKIILKLLL